LQQILSRAAVLQQVFCSRTADLQLKCGFSQYTQRIFGRFFAAAYLLHNRISLHTSLLSETGFFAGKFTQEGELLSKIRFDILRRDTV